MSTPGQRTYSVDLIGFSTADRTVFASTFALSQRRPIRYLHHLESATRPDLYLVDADDLKAMVEFAARSPDAMHPAILIGADTHGTQWPCVARPIRWMKLFELLDRSVELAEQARRTVPSHVARNQWPFVDRRSRTRLDVDLDVADYTAMRANLNSTSAGVLGAVMTVPAAAGDEVHEVSAQVTPDPLGQRRVLLADGDGDLSAEIERLCAGRAIVVDRAEGSEQALALLTQYDYALVFLDRELAGVGALEICRFIKARHGRARPTMVLTNARAGAIERVRSNLAGCDAQLVRPIELARLQAMFAVLDDGRPHDGASGPAA